MNDMINASMARTAARRVVRILALVLVLAAAPALHAADPEMVINEIMYHPYASWPATQPYPNTNRSEFVELYNAGAVPVVLSDYRLEDGIDFQFPTGITVQAGEYVVICENMEGFTNAYPGVNNLVGQFNGGLNNGGERITLSRRVGNDWITEDTFEYIDDDGSDGLGRSLELINPGFARLRDQYYGDWAISTAVSGTPGVVNSAYQPTPPPVVGDVLHAPPLPPAASAVKVTARITGIDGDAVTSALLEYRKDTNPQGAWSSTNMIDSGGDGDAVGGDGIYTGFLPPYGSPLVMAQGEMIEYRIKVTDAYGTRTFPATNRAGVLKGPYSYFVKFGDDAFADCDYRGEYETFHILMTASNKAALYARTNTDPANPEYYLWNDDLFDATIITASGKIFHNSGTRFRGGSSRNILPRNYRIDLPNGRKLHGQTRINLNHQEALRQHIGMVVTDWSTGGHSFDTDLARLYVNNEYLDPGQHIFHRFENFGGGMMDRIYGPEGGGNRYASDGDDKTGRLEYLGETPSSYFSKYWIDEVNPYTAWYDLIDLTRDLNEPASSYPSILTNHMNTVQWARLFATQVAIDNREAGMLCPHSTYGDELRLVVNPADGRFDIYPWDYDDVIGSGARLWWDNVGDGAPIVRKFLLNRPISPYYFGDVHDIITSVMSQERMSTLFDEMGSKMAGSKATYLSTIQAQRDALQGKINTNMTVNGYIPGSPLLLVPSTNASATLEAPPVNQWTYTGAWVHLGAISLPAGSGPTVRLRRTNASAVYSTIADAVMISNAVQGGIIFEDVAPDFTTLGTWSTLASGGYQNGPYHKSTVQGSSATWAISPPADGLYDIYAWVFYVGRGDTMALYDAAAGEQFGVLLNLSGKASQLYTDRVTVEGVDANYVVTNGAWTMSAPIGIPGDVAEITIRALHPDGYPLQSLNLTAIANRTPTPVSGTVSSSTTWTPDEGVFVVTNDLTVSSGVTLTIDPGTILLFNTDRKITVAGTLKILGTASAPVHLYAQGSAAPWALQASGATATMLISNVVMATGRVIAGAGSHVTIADSTLSDSPHVDGIIDADAAANVQVLRTVVRNFGRTSFTSTPALIEDSLLEGMTSVGAAFSGGSAVTVRRTTLRNPAGTDGITFDGVSSGGLVTNAAVLGMSGTGIVARLSTVTIADTLIAGCGTGLNINGSSSANVRNVTLAGGTAGIVGSPSVINTIAWALTGTAVSGSPPISYSDIQLPGSASYAGTGNLNRNPWFRAPAETDYQLQAISPCIAAGSGGVNMGVPHPVGANPTAPGSPGLVPSANSMTVTWTDLSANETGFEVYRLVGGAWTLVGTTAANSTQFADSGLAQNTAYTYRVRAIHARGASTFTDAVTASTTYQSLTEQLVAYLRVTELMYNQPGPDDGEFIEFKNISTNVTLDLSWVYTDDNRFIFPNGTMLAPQAFFVLVRDPAFFTNLYPGVTVNGVYMPSAPGLDNGGETIWVKDSSGTTILSFDYSDSSVDWYPTTDGEGYSLVVAEPNPAVGDDSSPLYWRASANPGGSPGADDPDPNTSGIVINEILAHTDPPLEDAVEIRNIGTNTVDISGWYLSDSPSLLKRYQIPAMAPLAPGAFHVFYEGTSYNQDTNDPAAFEISSLGDEDIYLSAAEGGNLTGYRSVVKFRGAIENGVSFGRYTRSDGDVEFVAMSLRSFGMDNPSSIAEFRTGTGLPNPPPKVGPVVINEIMYNPTGGGKEFIELLNISSNSVPLFLGTNVWRFHAPDTGDAIKYRFPVNTTMAPGEHVLVTGIEPTAFRQLLAVPDSIRIFGPFDGDLANSGESVEFYKPDNPEANGFVPLIIVDRVRYDDAPPWPTAADNGGPSLERIDPHAYGNDPTNWVAGTIGGTPGFTNNAAGLPAVSFRRVSSQSYESNIVIWVEVVLEPGNANTVTVDYATLADGTGTPGVDFTATSGSLVFWPHDTNHVIALTLLDDATPGGEPDKTVILGLTNLSANAIYGGNRLHTHTVIDTDGTSIPAPTIYPAVTTDFTNSIAVEMQTTVPYSVIYYTLDGSLPTRDDLFYAGPITLTVSARVTARTFLGSYNAGGSASVLFRAQPVPSNYQPPVGPTNTIEVTVIGGQNDGYENGRGFVYANTNITFGFEAFPSVPGTAALFRFQNVGIPRGVNVTNAYVQFTSAATDSGTLPLTVKGEATDTSAPIVHGARYSISVRPTTSATVAWSPPAWSTSARGPAQRTPNIEGVLDEIVGRGGWGLTNSLSILIYYNTAGILRSPRTYEDVPAQAAMLHAEWTYESEPPVPPNPPLILGMGSVPTNQFQVMWLSETDALYLVYKTADLVIGWPTNPLTGDIPGDASGTNTFMDANATNSAAFYRIDAHRP